MPNQYYRIKDKLREVAEDQCSSLTTDNSVNFNNRVTKWKKHFHHINKTTLYLQTRKLILDDCVDALDILRKYVADGKYDPASDLYQYNLKDKYICNESDIVNCKVFESGVYKIQRKLVDEMTDEKKEACSKLEYEVNVQPGKQIDPFNMTVQQRVALKKRKRCNKTFKTVTLFLVVLQK